MRVGDETRRGERESWRRDEENVRVGDHTKQGKCESWRRDEARKT